MPEFMVIYRFLCLLTPVIPLVAIFMALVILNWNIPENSIRELGRFDKTATIFNSSLILAGTIGILYSTGLYFKVSNTTGRMAISFLITGYAFIALIGIFPIGNELHSSLCIGLVISVLLSMSLFIGYLSYLNKTLALSNCLILIFGSIAIIYGILYAKNILLAEISGLLCFIAWHFTVLLRIS